MLHELWVDRDGCDSFCLAGPLGDGARAMLEQPAHLAWIVEAASSFEAMTLYYEYRGQGVYTSDFEAEDRTPYTDRGWE